MKNPKILTIASVFFALLLYSNNVFAQNTIIGKVIDVETLDPGGNGNLPTNPYIYNTFIKHQEPMVTY